MAEIRNMFHGPEARNQKIRDQLEMDGYGYQSRLPGGISLDHPSNKTTIAGAVFCVCMAAGAFVTLAVLIMRG